MRRSRSVAIQTGCTLLFLLTLWAGYSHFSAESWSSLRYSASDQSELSVSETTNSNFTSPGKEPQLPVDDESSTAALNDAFNTEPYVTAIFETEDTTFSRLQCPAPDHDRYSYLKAEAGLKYFFALDLRQNVDILPRLLGSVIEAITFLGPSACALSIVEGFSTDGTREVLYALRPALAALGVSYTVRTSDINPAAGERIPRLAALRNEALMPLTALPAESTQDATVIFLNDVAACANDILELVHQRAFQGADMTCAMDWVYVGRDPTFYDVWVARTLGGDLFFDIPPDGNWNSAWNLFWNEDGARARFHRRLPFQVFACWNGAVAFGAAPLFGEEAKVEFRGPREGECDAGEPTLFGKDLWWRGAGRIAVVPSVNLEYSDEKAAAIKEAKGYTSRWTGAEDEADTRIEWVDQPPDLVACMPGLGDKSWRPWNETLA
ncbi:alpha-1,3-mannosyltransferase CMT1 [Xylariaceae sp. FL0016]|nr:alpha-1,3-mannosyltransferase CMT1 [Xylariaceae sp. FL0016]